MVFDSMEQRAMAFTTSCHAELGDSLGFVTEQVIVCA